ncbi:MarR family transcriptional regulator [Micromonospora sp. BRA006-A]|nr:MarR family transcriptional regulator [Micromonospora sp. BRA006-A]
MAAPLGSIRLTDLAAKLGIGKGTLSRQIGGLEALGLVRRDPDPDRPAGGPAEPDRGGHPAVRRGPGGATRTDKAFTRAGRKRTWRSWPG